MKKTSIIVIFSLTVIIAGYIGIDFFKKWHKAELLSSQEQIQSDYDQKVSTLEQKIRTLEDELETEKNFYLSAEKLNDAFGRDIKDLISEKSSLTPEECTAIKQAIASFFNYLDNNGYSDRYKLKAGTYDYYKSTLLVLSRNPPKFSGESAEFLNLLRSMSHFSRIMGRTGTLIVKDVLENETDIMEPAMALFYQLFQNRETCTVDGNIPSLSNLYEYAYFFMNTLSGKSYLMRRNSKLRILVSYYSLMIVQAAEQKSMNLYGLDTRSQAELLLYDIDNHKGLMYKKTYIDHLERIIETAPGAIIQTQDTMKK